MIRHDHVHPNNHPFKSEVEQGVEGLSLASGEVC